MCKDTSKMDTENEELYLMKLKRFVLDEDKIVTAVWLSKECNIDIHSSHALLKQFVEDQTSSKDNQKLGISYTLIGNFKDTDALNIMIVKHDQLEEKRRLFKDVTSEEVHSIQKAMDVNFNTIGLVDMFELHGDKGTLLGCTVSNKCVLRTNLPNKVLPTVTRAAGTDKSKASHLFVGKTKDGAKATSSDASKKEDKPIKTEVKSEKTEENKTEKKSKLTKQKSDEKKPGSNSIANMFAKAPPPKEKKAEEKPVKTEAMDIDDEDTEEDEQLAFITTLKKSPKVEKQKKPVKSELYDSGTDEEAHKVEAANKTKNKDVKSSTTAKKKVTRTKRQRDKSAEMPQKKRKRIVQHVESDDDIFADEDDEENEASTSNVIMSDDDVSPSKNTKALAAKNRKRKYVEKTYEDEEGYIVTKKEVVYESADSEEDKENPPPKKEVTKKPAPQKETKEPSPPTKKKKAAVKPANQPTLMNFFKKK